MKLEKFIEKELMKMFLIRTLQIILLSLCCNLFAEEKRASNPNVDYDVVLKKIQEIKEYRKKRLISEKQFREYSKESNTIILDSRSKRAYEVFHIKGAKNLSFTEFSKGALEKIIPNKETRILIYCNNNFNSLKKHPTGFTENNFGHKRVKRLNNAIRMKTVGTSLNIPTFTHLYTYGYMNIYELSPVIDMGKSTLEFTFFSNENSKIKLPNITSLPMNMKGKLKKSLGTVMKIQGYLVRGRIKGSSRLRIRVQRIDGIATQEDIELELDRFYWGRITKKDLKELMVGDTYEFYGFETGEFVGVPIKIIKKISQDGMVPQTTGYYLRLHFSIYEGSRIKKIKLTPTDFIDRKMLVEGKAVNWRGGSFLFSKNWRLQIDLNNEWNPNYLNKKIVAVGVIRKSKLKKKFILEKVSFKLSLLKDQLGQNVELRGMVWNKNGIWKFRHKGVDLKIEKKPGFLDIKNSYHWMPVCVNGFLKENLKSKNHDDKKKGVDYVIVVSSLKRIDALLSPERGPAD